MQVQNVGSDTPKKDGIETQIKELDKDISSLNETVANLSNRLKGVLIDAPSTMDERDSKEPMPPTSQFHLELMACDRNIRHIQNQVLEIIHHLDL